MKKILFCLTFGIVLITTGVKVAAYCGEPECGEPGKECWQEGYHCRAKCCIPNPPGCTPGELVCEECDAECGGGRKTCTDGCTTTNPTCNTQPCCTYSAWVDGACGNTTNGCGYEERIQTRTVLSGGCTTGTRRCVEDTTCPWPIEVNGIKVLEPGGLHNSSATGAIDPQPVSVSGVGTFNANPYSSGQWSSRAGVTKTVSVPVLEGYDIGYTSCINQTNCHNLSNLTAGNTYSLSETAIRSAGGNDYTNPYLSLYWHYCPSLGTAPTGLTVQGLQLDGTVCRSAGQVTARWDNMGGGIAAYEAQLLNTSNLNRTTRLITRLETAPYPRNYTNFNVSADTIYSIRVRAQNLCNSWGPWGEPIAFTPINCPGVTPVPPPCEPPDSPSSVNADDIGGAIRISWNDGGDGEGGYRVWRRDEEVWIQIAERGSLAVGETDFVIDTTVTCGEPKSYLVEAFSSDPLCAPSTPATAIGNCVNYQAWYQIRGGGAAAVGGEIGVNLPPGAPPPYFSLDNEQGIPGMVYGVGIEGNLTSVNANSRRWLLSVSEWSNLLRPNNTYFGMKEKITARVQSAVGIYGTLDQFSLRGQIDGAGAQARTETDGVVVLFAQGDVILADPSGTIDLGSRKALLLAEGTVTIDSGISVSSGGFWAILANGDINISPDVGNPAGTNTDLTIIEPHITGIYYTSGVFDTGSNGLGSDRQIRFDGSIIGMGGVNLRRNIPGLNPAEYVNFRPDLTLMLHRVGLRTQQVQELMIP